MWYFCKFSVLIFWNKHLYSVNMCMLFDKNLVSIYNSCIFGFETGFIFYFLFDRIIQI